MSAAVAAGSLAGGARDAVASGRRDWRVRLLAALRWGAWLLSGFLALVLMSAPVGVDAQLRLSLTLICGMGIVWLFRRTRFARTGFITLAVLLVLRYVYWRVTSTLPNPGDTIYFALGLILLAAELYCVLILSISLIINADPLERTIVVAEDRPDLPTVDVYIPTYNEDEEILAMTVAAAMAMDYPRDKVTVWLLDDGGTDQKCNDKNPEKAAAARARRASLQKLCADLGAVYSTRAKNEHAKAGNMNACIGKSSGELILVLDADHTPFRSFLRDTVDHFAKDPKLFLVQTPHIFLNPDPIEKNLDTFGRMPSENEMFYSMTQRGLDKWNGSFFCGSGALLRRSALKDTGGFSGVTITEDCETAFELHARGWTSVFVDKPLIAGLQPETFDSFVGQRSRWCQGMFQIMLLKNPAFKSGLKPIQRLAYLSSMTFWFFPLPRLVFMFAPLLHIFLDVKIFTASVDETVAYTATYVVANLMLQNYLYGRLRWPFVSELYEYVQGVFLARAIVAVCWSPRKPTFNVTAKGLSLEHDHLSPLAWPFVAIFAALAVGVGTAAFRYMFEPGVTNLMLVVGLWATFNLVIAGAALGAVAERRQPDRHPRLAIDRAVEIALNGRVQPAQAISVSASGCAVRLDPDAFGELGPLAVGNSVRVAFTSMTGERLELETRLTRLPVPGRLEIGLEFAPLRTADYPAVADLMYGDAGAMIRFLQGRRAHKNLFTGTFQFVLWGFKGPLQAFRFALKGRPPEPVAATAEPVATEAAAALPVAEAAPASTEPASAPPELASAVALPATPVQPAPTVGRTGPVAAEWRAGLLALVEDELRARRTRADGRPDRLQPGSAGPLDAWRDDMAALGRAAPWRRGGQGSAGERRAA